MNIYRECNINSKWNVSFARLFLSEKLLYLCIAGVIDETAEWSLNESEQEVFNNLFASTIDICIDGKQFKKKHRFPIFVLLFTSIAIVCQWMLKRDMYI